MDYATIRLYKSGIFSGDNAFLASLGNGGGLWFRQPSKTYWTAARIWKETFLESDDYLDLFFREMFRPEMTIVHSEGDRVNGAFYIIETSLHTPWGR
jgi:hypothetical protein